MNILDFIAAIFAFITIGMPLTFSMCWLMFCFCISLMNGDNRK